jgi:hypothetical protein
MGALTFLGTVKEGQIAEAQGKFAKDVSIKNNEALVRQAKAEREASKVKEARVSRQAKITKASQRAALGKSGGGAAGATLSLLADTASQFSIDRNLILRSGLIKSRELTQRGQILLSQGRFARSQGLASKRASLLKGFGKLGTDAAAAAGGGA